MKRLLFLQISIFVALLHIGCGGSTTTSQQTAMDQPGRLVFKVKWPDALSRVIPDETERIEVSVRVGSRTVDGTIPKGRDSIVIDDCPSGKSRVEARGHDASGRIIVSAAADLDIEPNQTNPVELELKPVPGFVDEDNWTLGGTAFQDPNDPEWIQISLTAIIDKDDREPVLGLTEKNFIVLEDEIEMSPVQVTPMESAEGNVDIVFLIDTTGSMSEEIDGVKNSVIEFAMNLDAKGKKVRVGAVAFGDDVRATHELTEKYEAFSNWVGNLYAYGGDDAPENPLDAAMVALMGSAWRADSSRVVVVITDAPMHHGADDDGITSATVASVTDAFSGNAVIHSISPGSGYAPRRGSSNDGGSASSRDYAIYPDAKALSDATGGIWNALPNSGDVDLNALGIIEAIQQGYIIRFKSVYGDRDRKIRLIARDNDDNLVADQVYPAHY